MHLLVARGIDRSEIPERFLVTFTEQMCGPIRFSRPGWMSDGVQLISASLRRDRYEVIALMSPTDWIVSRVGFWMLSHDRSRLLLTEPTSGDQS